MKKCPKCGYEISECAKVKEQPIWDRLDKRGRKYAILSMSLVLSAIALAIISAYFNWQMMLPLCLAILFTGMGIWIYLEVHYKECADREIPWNTPEARKIITSNCNAA